MTQPQASGTDRELTPQKVDRPRYQPWPRTHGAGSPSVIEPMADGILAWLLDLAERPNSPIAFVVQEQFAPTLDKWARAEARRLRYEQHLADHGEFEESGDVRPMMGQLLAWEKRAASHAAALGLDPPSLARIQKDLAELHREEDAAQAMSELQAKYARRVIDQEPNRE